MAKKDKGTTEIIEQFYAIVINYLLKSSRIKWEINVFRYKSLLFVPFLPFFFFPKFIRSIARGFLFFLYQSACISLKFSLYLKDDYIFNSWIGRMRKSEL